MHKLGVRDERDCDGDAEPPLVGRALELRSIAESREAGGVGFVLAGSSGVGKTRLRAGGAGRSAAGGRRAAVGAGDA